MTPLAELEADFEPFIGMPQAGWRTIGDTRPDIFRAECAFAIAMTNWYYAKVWTDRWKNTAIVAPSRTGNLVLLEVDDGLLFYTWMKLSGMDMLSVMSGETPTMSQWKSRTGGLFINDMVATEPVHPARAFRAVVNSTVLLNLAEIGDRIVYRREASVRADDRIGYAIASLKTGR